LAGRRSVHDWTDEMPKPIDEHETRFPNVDLDGDVGRIR
jgi:hypothetical protein